MENSERQFEGQWQEIFRDAESAPPEGAWLSIENSLMNAENDSNKRRVIVYRRVAASLLLITASSLLITFWTMKDAPEEAIVKQETNVTPPSSRPIEDTPQDSHSGSAPGAMAAVQPDHAGVRMNFKKGDSGQKEIHSSRASGHGVPTMNSLAVAESSQKLNDTTEQEKTGAVALKSSEQVARLDKTEPVKDLTAAEEKALVKKLLGEDDVAPEPKIIGHPAWASLGFAGGSYAPNTSSSLVMASLPNASTGSNYISSPSSSSKRSSGTSYSVGVMFGKQVGRRLIVQTGLTYLTQRMDYESNRVATMGNTQTAFGDYSQASSVTTTNPYTVQSNSEFVSIPVQVGYIFLDRKFGILAHTGISSDFFIRNTLTDQSGKYNSTSESGDGGAFRSVSWSGLANTEFSYRIAEQYRISLVPGVRYSFTSIVKDDVGTNQPLVFDLGLRFRYIFK